jgi:TolB-like protein/Flp pilus assembly protein TadD
VNGSTESGPAEFWTRLRRRKVVQWGLVYLAAAWGFLQGLEYMAGTYDWPRQIQQLTTLAFLIGLPMVLVLAWYHGDRGQQRITTPEFAILTLLLLLGGGAFWYYQGASESEKVDAPTASAVQPGPSPGMKDARPSVAVLPFENRSREADDAFFVDGIHDDILTQLSKVSALRVISRTSVEQFRDTKLSMKAIADQLGVSKVLEGGVQRAGDRVRIHVQLIDATSDAHIWAESYDRELSAANIFAIQTELAAAIASALETTLTPAEQERAKLVPTRNLDAWEAYQLGKQRLAKRTSEALADAERFFRDAIDHDPKFALAHTGLADTLLLQVPYGSAPAELNQRNAETAVAKALELDPNLAEAWASSAGLAQDRRQNDRAEPLFLRAIELNPNYASARHWYSLLLADVGRLDESVAQAQRAMELDPLSAAIRKDFGSILELQGRFPEAERLYRRAMAIDPTMPAPYMFLAGLNAYAHNNFADAVPLAERATKLDSGNPGFFANLALLYLDLGDDVEVSRLLKAARQRWSDDEPAVTLISVCRNLLRGDEKAALQGAQKLVDVIPGDWIGLVLLGSSDVRAGRTELAQTRYTQAYPELVATQSPRIDAANWFVAIELAGILQKTGEETRARVLLDRSEQFIRAWPRLGRNGFGIADAQIHALRGDQVKALVALREAEKAGWRGQLWRLFRDLDPALASIRNEPEFKAVFADIERDMAQQRARLAARPKDAPLDLAATGT